MTKPKVDISNVFANAGQSQKVHQLSKRIEELEAQINQLKRASTDGEDKAFLEVRIQELIEELAAKQGVEEIAINLIDCNPSQPRQTFTKASIQGMAELLRREGQNTPIILVPLSNRRYMLFDGERRWRAATLLGWQTLKAVMKPAGTGEDNRELHRQALSTTLHREDLNALDLAEALLQQIVYNYPNLEEQKDEIPRLLNTAMSRLERERKNLELADIKLASKEAQQNWLESVGFRLPEEQDIFEVILELQLNPASVDANIFPMLKLAQDIKTVVRREGLEASKAKELDKLSAQQLNTDEECALTIRTQATQKVVQEKLSLSQIKVLVKEIINRNNPSEAGVKQLKKVNKAIKSIQEMSFKGMNRTHLQELQQILEAKLQEIENSIKNYTI